MIRFGLLLAIGFFAACSKITPEAGKSSLKFKIIDQASKSPVPAKLIFIQSGDEGPKLGITNADDLCAEDNGFYTASGKGAVELPAGSYEVYASRGMEYSIDKKKVVIQPDKVTSMTWKIRREIDPQGFVACDFHTHTTNSDGRPTPEERLVSLMGEGLELAAITDHNYLTDLSPQVQQLDAGRWIQVCIGDEYTTAVGHYNVYPLKANQASFDHATSDARIQFGLVHALQGPVVLQVNHPRMEGLGYFGHFDLSPLTSETENPQFSWDFDALEVMNDTPGWGLFTGEGNRFSVWDDWFNFLNKDFRPTAVGNSDTHGSISCPPGTPRTYVMSNARTPGEINRGRIARKILEHKVTVARGVFVNLTANKQYAVGSELVAKDRKVELLLQVLAPSWVRIEKVRIYGNGREVWSGEIEATKKALKYEKKISLQPAEDTWYVAKAEGSESLWPVAPRTALGEVTPVGFTNPIWVDVDGDGFECERDRAAKLMKVIGDDERRLGEVARASDWITQKQLYAVAPKDSKAEHALVKMFVYSEQQIARELAYARLAQIGDQESIALLREAQESAASANEKVLATTYLAALGDCADRLEFMKKVVVTKDPLLKASQIKILSTNNYVRNWRIIGPFPNADNKGLETAFGPEQAVDLSADVIGRDSLKVRWQPAEAGTNGFVNFLNYYGNFDHSVAYAFATIEAPEEMESVLLFGSDDGAAIWHNGQQIYYRFIRRGANPGQEIIPLTLKKGENSFLAKVENGGGGSGFYFELYDPCGKIAIENKY